MGNEDCSFLSSEKSLLRETKDKFKHTAGYLRSYRKQIRMLLHLPWGYAWINPSEDETIVNVNVVNTRNLPNVIA